LGCSRFMTKKKDKNRNEKQFAGFLNSLHF
jgi:hypothetical protein